MYLHKLFKYFQSRILTKLAGLLLGASLFLLTLLPYGPAAHAVCVNVAGVVTCAMDDTDGVVTGMPVTDFTVNSGVTVDDSVIQAFPGIIELTGGNFTGTFLNNGTIRDVGPNQNSDVIRFGGFNVTNFINNGLIDSGTGGNGISGIGSLFNFTNTGTIQTDNVGVSVSGGATTMNNSGTIRGTDGSGLSISGGLNSLTNSGLIQGGTFGDGIRVSGGDLVTLLNTSTGIIQGNDRGLNVGFANNLINLTNFGLIRGVTDEGINVQNDVTSLINHGTIRGFDAGLNINGNLMSLTNFGQILSDDNEAILVLGNITSLINHGTIQGNEEGVFVFGNLMNLTNFGLIQGGNNREGIRVLGDVTSLTNNGTIHGGGDGIEIVGNVSSIINNGTIQGENFGVSIRRNALSLINTGTIRGLMGLGINVNDTLTLLNNSGTIVGDSEGVNVNDDILTLINSGLIQGLRRTGVNTPDNIQSLNNSGTILGNTEGVNAGMNITSLINSGTIRGITRNGVNSGADIINLMNTGTIMGNTNGVNAFRNLVSLTNTGTIIGNQHGIDGGTGDITQGILSLTNAGVITAGPGFNAVNSDGGANTILTLNVGSNIFGGLDLGGGTNTLNVGLGHNIDHVFAMLPQVINTNGMPTVIDGNRVVVINPGGFAFDQQDEMLFDLSQGIWDTVFANIGGRRGPGNGVTNGFNGFNLNGPPQPYNLGGIAAPLESLTGATGFHSWSSIVGRHRDQSGDALSSRARHELYGMISGFDGLVSSGLRVGGFFGQTETDIEVVNGITSGRKNESIFGGLYGSLMRGDYKFDFGFTAGLIEQEGTQRIVDNNRVNGLQIVTTGDVDGTFIAPEISLLRRFYVGPYTVQSAARLGYAGVFFDGAAETGGAAPVTLGDRDLGIIHGRFELALLIESMGADGLNSYFSPYVGVAGRSLIDGDTQAITVLGQNLTFSANSEDDVGSAFAGLRLTVWKDGIYGLFADVEGSIDTTQSSVVTGRAGFKMKF